MHAPCSSTVGHAKLPAATGFVVLKPGVRQEELGPQASFVQLHHLGLQALVPLAGIRQHAGHHQLVVLVVGLREACTPVLSACAAGVLAGSWYHPLVMLAVGLGEACTPALSACAVGAPADS